MSSAKPNHRPVHSRSSDDWYDVAEAAPFDTTGRAYAEIFRCLSPELELLARRFKATGAVTHDDYAQAGKMAVYKLIWSGKFNRRINFRMAANAVARAGMVELARVSRNLEKGTAGRHYRKIVAAHDRLYARNGRPPTVDEVVEEVNKERKPHQDRIGAFVVGFVLRSLSPPVRLDDLDEVRRDGLCAAEEDLRVDADEVEAGPMARRLEGAHSVMGAVLKDLRPLYSPKELAHFGVLLVLGEAGEMSGTDLARAFADDDPEFDGRIVGKDGEAVRWPEIWAYHSLGAYGVSRDWREVRRDLFRNEGRGGSCCYKTFDNTKKRLLAKLAPLHAAYC